MSDVLVVSAFRGDYYPLPDTMIGCIHNVYGISVSELVESPVMDLRELGVWISKAVTGAPFGALACVELIGNQDSPASLIENLFFCLKKYASRGGAVRTVAMPLIGMGSQCLDGKTIFVPLLAECINALETIGQLEKVVIFERSASKYNQLLDSIAESLPGISRGSVFISYSHHNLELANLVADVFEQEGIKTWIDHRKIRNPDYAAEIVNTLRNSFAYLILVSRYSLASPDVLRELRNAGDLESSGSLRIYQMLLEPIATRDYPSAYSYYLGGHEWCDISSDPVRPKALTLCEKLRQYSSHIFL